MQPTEVLEHETPSRDGRPSAFAECVLIIGRHRGLTLTLDDLELTAETKLATESTSQLVAAAERAGLHCRSTSMTWSALVRAKKRLPAIVRFVDGSAMVLVRIETGHGAPLLVLEDPNANRDVPLVLDRIRFELKWTGEVFFFTRPYTVIDETVPFGFRLISKLVMQDRQVVTEIVVATLAVSLIALSPIVFLRLISGRVLEYKSISTLVAISLIMFGLIVLETGLGFAKRALTDRLVTKVDVRLTTLLFNKLLRIPIDYFETTPVGLTIHSIVQLATIRRFIEDEIFGTLIESSVLLFFIPMMMFISFTLTMIVFFFFSLTIIWLITMMPRLYVANGRVISAQIAQGNFIYQCLAGIRTVKSLALDSRQRHQWSDLTLTTHGCIVEEGDVGSLVNTMVTVLQRFLVIGTMAAGVFMVIEADDPISLATLFTFTLLAQRVAVPLQQVAKLMERYHEARIAMGVIGSVINQPEEEGRSGQGLRTPIKGRIEFANLRFKYRGAVSPALRSVSFEIGQGMTFGVMGRSGSGKTTITRLLQRLHSDYQGLIKVDGIDIRDFDVDYFRSSLGVVLQDNFLFSGTIRDNITIAKSDATFDDVVRAARLAGAEEFIDKLPRGYDTVIYEGSPNLSGGQRQRIAIARALITDPKVLILDEATSALDAESEAIVNANIKQIAHGRTMIVISHRLSSLVNADAILVLDQGEVHDIGKHHDLLERCDIYSGLWHRQNAHLEGDAVQAPPKLIARGAGA